MVIQAPARLGHARTWGVEFEVCGDGLLPYGNGLLPCGDSTATLPESFVTPGGSTLFAYFSDMLGTELVRFGNALSVFADASSSCGDGSSKLHDSLSRFDTRSVCLRLQIENDGSAQYVLAVFSWLHFAFHSGDITGSIWFPLLLADVVSTYAFSGKFHRKLSLCY